MKIRQYQSVQQRKILTGLIVHDDILGKIYLKIGQDENPFGQAWLDMVARWCFKFYAKFGHAPKKAIHTLFTKYAERSKDEESIALLEKFLGELSDDYEQLANELNPEFVIDMASNHFKRVRLSRTIQEMEAAVEAGDLESAEECHSAYQRIDFGDDALEHPFEDEVIEETFRRSEEDQSVLRFSGDLDRFLSPYLTRTAFVSFAGPEKRGKSYWLLECVWQALRQGRRVLYYTFGDMSKKEIYQRLYCRATRRPWTTTKVSIPTGIVIDRKGNSATVEVREELREAVSPRDIKRARKKLLLSTSSDSIRLKVKSSGGYVVSASQIEQDLQQLAQREEWVADLVVIDYADLLEPEPHTKRLDVRHQINESWAILRRVALDNHCLLITATQAAARSYEKKVITKKDFSEDKRKNAHVTGMIGINQTPDEKVQGIYRLNWIALRGGKWSEHQVVWLAGSLALAAPALVSSF